MVRFISEDTVIINNYLDTDGYSKTFINKLSKSLSSHGLTIAGILLYRSFTQESSQAFRTRSTHRSELTGSTNSAIGCYINYLELERLIIFPEFGIPEDQPALDAIHRYFPNKKIHPLNCTEIARKGGVLNCISWECERI